MIPGIRTEYNITSDNAGMLPDKPLVPIDHLGGFLTQSIAKVDRRKAPASRVETPRSAERARTSVPNTACFAPAASEQYRCCRIAGG